MAKILNQLLYSSIIYGTDQPSGALRLTSTSSGMKGAIELVGSHFDLIINNQTGRFTHANSTTQTYLLPDYSGEVLVSGIFTDANQLVYSSAAGVYAILSSIVGSALVTTETGDIQWTTGAEGQVLTMKGGFPSFQNIPDVGHILPSTAANQLPYYVDAASNVLSPMTTLSSRAFLSTSSGGIGWTLISAIYLRALGNVPLGPGLYSQVLTANGDGTFLWVNPNPAVINAGTQYRLPYYSATSPGTTLSESSFLITDETAKSLSLRNRGALRFGEADAYGSSYIELKAPLSLGASTSFVLPPNDGLAGSYLQTDGNGNLTFVYVDNGYINAGLTNQIAYYAADGNDLSGLSTISGRVLGATDLGALSWMLVKPPYLATTGDVPLAVGTANQVLVSTGTGLFAWATAVDITGEVLSGAANHLAFYPSTGTKVDDISFLTVDNALNLLNILLGGSARYYPSTGNNYVGLTAPSSIALSFTLSLPAADGLDGHALVTDGSGHLSFLKVGRGFVHTGEAKTLAYYDTAIDEVYPLTNTASRVMLTSAGNAVGWNLITDNYLAAPGAVPLTGGLNNQVLTTDGFGYFQWTTASDLVGKVDVGQATRLSYYTGTTTVAGSSWLNNAESQKALDFLAGGNLRFYESTSAYYAAFTANPAMLANIQWYLPAADATSANQALISDSFGLLSFAMLVDTGIPTRLAYYTAANTVAGSAWLNSNEADKALEFMTGGSFRIYEPTDTYYASLLANVGATADLTWYLPAADATEAGQALTSDAAGHLSFMTLVANGVQNAVAVYQNGTAKKVSPSANFFNDASGLLLKGSIFSLLGDTTTTVKLNSASGKSVILGAASADLLSLDTGNWISVLYGATLRWFDSVGTKYVGFVAPSSVTTTTVWTLPVADGSADQVLITDGAGALSWVDLLAKNILDGTVGALAYYSGISEISSSSLLVPSGLPLVDLSSLVVSNATGQMSYAMLVSPGASTGNIGVYTAGQTIGYFSDLNWDDATRDLKVGSHGALALFNAADTKAVYLKAFLGLANDITLTLPAALPAENYYALIGATDGTLSFKKLVTPAATAGNIGVYTAEQTIGYYSALHWDTTGAGALHIGDNGSLALFNLSNTKSVSLAASPYLLDNVPLILPDALPAADGYAIVGKTDGTLSFGQLVTPGATTGDIGFYTATQTVGYSSDFSWNDTSKVLILGSNGSVQFSNLANTRSVTLLAAPTLANSFSLTLPGNLPYQDGFVLAGDNDGNLSFIEPSGDTRWEKRGVIDLMPSMRSVTVLYDEPFSAIPAGVQVQWMTSSGNMSYLPAYAIEKSTAEGFIVKFSVQVPMTGTYRLFWQSYLTAVNTSSSYLFMQGGFTTDYLAGLSMLALDLDTSISSSASLPSVRGYTAGGGSSTSGYTFGGETTGVLGLDTISAVAYATVIATDLSTSLTEIRSGAAGFGTRSKCYVAGGEAPGGATSLTIESFNPALETVSAVAAGLTAPSVRKGSATNLYKGVCIGNDGSITELAYATDTTTALGTTDTDVSVGANDVSSNYGYFGRDSGFLNRFDLSFGAMTALPVTFSSTVLSSAGNSLDKAYFGCGAMMESYGFASGTLSAVSSLPYPDLASASVSTFQSKGLL